MTTDATCRGPLQSIKDQLADAKRILRKRSGGLRLRGMQRLSPGRFAVTIRNHDAGFFALFVWGLYVLQHAERCGLCPDLRLQNPAYHDPRRGPCFLRQYFDRLTEGPDARFHIRVRHPEELRLLRDAPESFDNFHDLFHRHYRLKPEVAAMVDAFTAERFEERPTLGIHFRGTDKKSEAPRARFRAVFAAIDRALDGGAEVHRLFVASDEQGFIDAMKERYGRRRIVIRDDAARSLDGKPLHLAAGSDPVALGLDALLDCLLLSRSRRLIKTASCLSGCSKVFNPDLRVSLLNPPFPDKLFFPDRALLDLDPTPISVAPVASDALAAIA